MKTTSKEHPPGNKPGKKNPEKKNSEKPPADRSKDNKTSVPEENKKFMGSGKRQDDN